MRREATAGGGRGAGESPPGTNGTLLREVKTMTDNRGIWVKLVLDGGIRVTAFAPGADSPNDFWTVFKTQLVRLHDVEVVHPRKKAQSYPVLYVNRDKIVLVDAAGGPGA